MVRRIVLTIPPILLSREEALTKRYWEPKDYQNLNKLRSLQYPFCVSLILDQYDLMENLCQKIPNQDLNIVCSFFASVYLNILGFICASLFSGFPAKSVCVLVCMNQFKCMHPLYQATLYNKHIK